MKVLELFAGSRSIGKICDQMGIEVFSVDVKDFPGIDLVQDIEFLTPAQIPFQPTFIWASPPCTTYSIAGLRFHRSHGIPISDFAVKSDKLVMKVLELVSFYGCPFFIENPRGYLRKMPFMRDLPRKTVWYCQYGDQVAKPTDIWSSEHYSAFNPDGFRVRKECFNGNSSCHHDKQPRSYQVRKKKGLEKGGTSGRSGNFNRSILPPELCADVLDYMIEKGDRIIDVY